MLDRFYVHPIDLPDDAAIIEHATKVSEELNIALQKSKITTPVSYTHLTLPTILLV